MLFFGVAVLLVSLVELLLFVCVYVGRLLVCVFSTLCTSAVGVVMAQIFFFILRCSFSVAWLCGVCPSSCSISVCVSVLLLVAFFAVPCSLVEAVSGFVIHFGFLVVS